jgi:hypothetical protein
MTTNTESNHQAAGAAATTARSVVKEVWYKKPTILNVIIGAGVIAIALVINANFPFNLFWKLLLGGALIWGGGKLALTKVGIISLWGKIFKGLGWAIVVLALLNSGVRHIGEKTVNWVDQTLTEMAGREMKPGTLSFGDTEPAGDSHKVDLQGLTDGQSVTIWKAGVHSTFRVYAPEINIETTGGLNYWICPEVIRPTEIEAEKRLVVINKTTFGEVQTFSLTPDASLEIFQKHTDNFDARFTVRIETTPGKSPCHTGR